MDANREARWLTRRMLRRAPQRVAGRWAALVAVWAHLVFLLVAALVRPARPAEPDRPPAPLTLVLLEPAPVAPPIEPPPLLLAPGEAGPGAHARPQAGARSATGARPASAGGEGEGELVVRVSAPVSRHRVAPPSPTDPVEELRRALGFPPIDRSRLARGPSAAALLAELGEGQAQAAEDEPEVRWVPEGDLGGTDLGDYVHRVEGLVYARWRSADLDLHRRAIGIQGDVTVRYSIAADGTVSRIRITRSSGLPDVDGLAVRAIPPRLPRIPRELGLDELDHEITFRYHNPP